MRGLEILDISVLDHNHHTDIPRLSEIEVNVFIKLDSNYDEDVITFVYDEARDDLHTIYTSYALPTKDYVVIKTAVDEAYESYVKKRYIIPCLH